MLLLAVDTCDSRGSVAVLRDLEVLQTLTHHTSEDYSVWLLPAVQRALQGAGVAFGDLDAYAVAAGPGSFTGLRVGLTTAKAWAEVYGRGIAPVSRLEALATLAAGPEPNVATFADARRGQLFAALYRRRPHGMLERLKHEMLVAPDKFLAFVEDNAGGDPIQWISTEPACLTETEAWATRRSLGETVEAASCVLAPVIGRLGYRLALEQRLTDALGVDANYLQRTDAELFSKSGQTRK